MVSAKVHKELLRMAEERANRAEMKAMALERELRFLMEEQSLAGASSGDPPKIPPRRKEVKYPASSVGIRTSPKYFQKHSTLYSRGNLGAKRGQPAVSGGRTAGGGGTSTASNNRPTKPQTRTWSLSRLRKVEASKTTKEAKKENGKEGKNSGKVSFLQRVQSRVTSAQTKSEVQKSLFDRMQSRFFAKSSPKSSAAPASSSCDLPDLSSLEEESSKSEYEVPMDPVQRFAGTPLIDMVDLICIPKTLHDQAQLDETPSV
ncbi:uncharacterized protein LOC110990170 [Acanthaster planci]|uniref:Uncharacterized protein LOC110990170 n=1 Tax=Acanthaster planci TaxID=133434 RepID=A0A8B8A480_ACAPL|nr:uncharacterized protein LOC110990170 [Acanthaster planci]